MINTLLRYCDVQADQKDRMDQFCLYYLSIDYHPPAEYQCHEDSLNFGKKMEETSETFQDARHSQSEEHTRDQAASKGTVLASTKPATKRNAFSELMTPKPSKISKPPSSTQISDSELQSAEQPSSQNTTKPSSKSNFYSRHANLSPNDPRAGLLPYIQNPTAFPSTVVLRITEHTVLIRDLFPKSTIHLLLLPRSPSHYNLHPHDAFADLSFLELMKTEAESASRLAATELSRLLSSHSASSFARNSALDAPDPPDTLPPGRDYTVDIRTGIHAHPSMSHLHIHIMSRDMNSPALKHRKHYNSFNTDFFIPLSDYPLADDDPRRSVAVQNANLARGFVCWRCGKEFGNQFKRLKEHLEVEFKAWRAE